MAEALRLRARLSRRPSAAVAFACFFLTVTGVSQNRETFKLRLAPVSMDAAMKVNIAGSGSGSAILTGSKLNVNATFEGLLLTATTAQLHAGSATGVRGPVIFDLKVSPATNGNLSGVFDLTADQVESLRKGHFYLQLASEKVPDGNLWGWLLP
jgi:PPE-repeat protein